ncbi:MAG: adaptor protein MecA [Eubacteriales bacterium]|nr:adaptor protein MecA [Eubacteriales bacterium]
MKIERINDNQIRCTLTSLDLSSHNLNLGELAYGSEKARNLFREMIQKASTEVGFDAEDIPLMVEAIPLSNESVMLVITKIEDPEELDTRFSKFSPLPEEDQDGFYGGMTNELLEGADSLMDLLKNDLLSLAAGQIKGAASGAADPPAAEDARQAQQPAAPQTRIYRFGSLDAAADAARVTCQICQCPSALYKKPGTSSYYLVLSSSGCESLAFSRLCNVLAEYGEKIRQESQAEAYYQEHYDAIIKNQALQKLSLI